MRKESSLKGVLQDRALASQEAGLKGAAAPKKKGCEQLLPPAALLKGAALLASRAVDTCFFKKQG